jgi:hypothetical protein
MAHYTKFILLIMLYCTTLRVLAQDIAKPSVAPGPSVPKKATATLAPSGSGNVKPAPAKKQTTTAPNANRKYRGELSLIKWGCKATYTGDIHYQEPNGYGRLIFTSGARKDQVYEGNFVSGYITGRGTLTWPSGDKYVGEWKDNKENGQGTMTWPSGSSYVGEYRDDVKNGRGVYTWSDGSKYNGEWRDNNMNGQGTMVNVTAFTTCPKCIKYVGNWKDDEKSGYGKCYDAAGKLIYSGSFEADKPTGKYPN